jgi:hypothetical protein
MNTGSSAVVEVNMEALRYRFHSWRCAQGLTVSEGMMWACGVERAAGKCARRAPRANHDDRPTPESARRNARPTTKPHRRDRSALATG